MKVSVVLPAYNAAETIERAIDSILNQTFGDFELLVINDGSTDDTERLIDAYKDARIKAVHLERNVGLIEVLNKGIELASGEYIARMDADDISLPTRFSEQIRFLDQHQDYVACGTSIINFTDRAESYMRYPTSDAEIRVALSFFERNICHPTVMIRKSVLDQFSIQYRKEYPHAEDYRLWLDLAKVGKLHNLEQGLLKYYRHANQVSSKYYSEQIEISKALVKESLQDVWSNIDEELVQGILQLCVHQQNVYPSTHFPLQLLNETIKKVIQINERTPHFDDFYLKRLLYFKKFRCSFYYFYRFNYLTKLRCFSRFFIVEPRRAMEDIKMHAKMSYVKRFGRH